MWDMLDGVGGMPVAILDVENGAWDVKGEERWRWTGRDGVFILGSCGT
jgi:hypothetical protein